MAVAIVGIADGAERLAAQEAGRAGHLVRYYSHRKEKALEGCDFLRPNPRDYYMANVFLHYANRSLRRRYPPSSIECSQRLQLKYCQERDAQSVYVVGYPSKVIPNPASAGAIRGAAGWVAQMFADRLESIGAKGPIPLYFFNQLSERWYQGRLAQLGTFLDFEEIQSVPRPSGIYTVSGTSDLTAAGVKAIRDLYIS